MVWRPNKVLGLIVGLVILLTIIGIQLLLVRSALGRELDLNLFVTWLLVVFSLPLAVLWGVWYVGLATLHYRLDRNALTIVCGAMRHIVPMDRICRIVPGDQVTVADGFRGVGWPGYLYGRMRLAELGVTLVRSTEPLDRQLVVVTDSACYGISPQHTERFLADFAARRTLGPVREVPHGIEWSDVAALPLWSDGWFWAIIALALVANAALFGLVAGRYGELPERIPLHFDGAGQPDRIAQKSGLLIVPAIGAVSLLLNAVAAAAVHLRERLAAHMLACTALVVQGVSWLATFSIFSW